MNFNLGIMSFEQAVWNDLRRQGRREQDEATNSPTTPQSLQTPMDPRSPGQIWNPYWGGFSGWITVGTLANFPPASNDGTNKQQNQRIVNTLQRHDPSVHDNTHMVYRLVYTGRSKQSRKRTIYIGSAIRGQVAQRLHSHLRGGSGASSALYDYLRSSRIKSSNIRVDVGYVTNQRHYPARSIQDNLNYNTLFLIEKILQRRERPRIWDPTDRTFDEDPMSLLDVWM